MNTPRDQRLLTIKQLAVASGLSVSTLRRRVREGVLAAIQLGGRGKKLMFAASIVDQLCQANAHEGKVDRSTTTCSEPQQSGQIASTDPAAAINDSKIALTRPTHGRIPAWMQDPLLTDQSTK